ncbi:50S ribosomal protein L35 [Aerococcus mictus]|uniref:50S ribosomal protein L35 n=1 Tax=Aerococcus mictus TaxID=2976810 RepID=UPI000DCD0D0F|nr:50S ribosomal protein L35 [Aerococcus mictus]WMF95071.1 50S ribosomal protein L35 [Aerococcus mictus]
MPKQKTHRASAKRFKRTASGKLKRSHSERSHRFHGKTKKQRRQHKQPAMVHVSDQRRIEQMLDTYK